MARQLVGFLALCLTLVLGVVLTAQATSAYRTVYYHNDALGTPQRITDKAANIIWAADYDAYHAAQVKTTANPALALTNNLRYPGQYFDAETALHYYDTNTGRYTKGTSAQRNEQLSYEKVTDLFISHKPQKLIHLTLDNGQTLTATENHPFKTTDGWRDAILLKKGGKLLLKGGDDERVAIIAAIRIETKTLSVFNLEVANAHTFFVGVDGAVVHNGNGSYTCHFTNGMKYHGKGDEKRALESMKRLEKDRGITGAGKPDWSPAKDTATSFKDEAARIAKDGGIGRGEARNYNLINSPGAKP